MDNRNLYLNSQTFCLLIEIGSFTGVAKRLTVTQSTVSRRISALEEEIGLQLIKRNTRGFTLTESGEKYYNFFKQQDQIFSSGIQEFRNLSDTDNITVRLALPLGIANAAISPYLAEFLQNHPQLTLHLFYQNREVDLIKENYDLVILRHRPKHQTVMIKKLYQFRIHLYCTPEYINRYGKPKSLEDLANHFPIGEIHDDNTIALDTEIRDVNNNRVTIKFNPRCLINSLEPAYKLAMNGHAIVGGTDFLYQQEIADHRLIKILPEYRFSLTELFLVRIKTQHHPLIDSLIEFLEQCFKKIHDSGDN